MNRLDDVLLKIGNVDDRMTVAGALIKNGYKVSEVRVRENDKKAYEYYLLVESGREELTHEGKV